MLPVEFYFLNATTTLLWLCQTLPHEVLLFLLALGALCVIVSVCIVVFRIVSSCSVLLKLSLFTINYLLRKSLSKYFNTSVIPSFALRNIIQPVNEPSRFVYQGQSLTLPQILALHSGPWTNLNMSHTDSTLPDSITSTETSPRITSEPSPLTPLTSTTRVPLRRSSRIIRARARLNV